MLLKSLKVVWFCCEAAFGRLRKEDLAFLMFLMNRIGSVKCLRQLVYLCVYIGEDVFVLRIRRDGRFFCGLLFPFPLANAEETGNY